MFPIFVNQLHLQTDTVEILQQLLQFSIAEVSLRVLFQQPDLVGNVAILARKEVDDGGEEHVHRQNRMKERIQEVSVMYHVYRHPDRINKRIELEVDVEGRDIEDRGNHQDQDVENSVVDDAELGLLSPVVSIRFFRESNEMVFHFVLVRYFIANS